MSSKSPIRRSDAHYAVGAAEQTYALYLSRDKTTEELRALAKFADTTKTRRIMRMAQSFKSEMNRS